MAFWVILILARRVWLRLIFSKTALNQGRLKELADSLVADLGVEQPAHGPGQRVEGRDQQVEQEDYREDVDVLRVV